MISEELGNPETVLSLDVRDEEAVERTITEVITRFGQLDIIRTYAVEYLNVISSEE